jgi:hypothetical protein
MIKWVKFPDEIPPKNVLVWVKRVPNRIEDEPIYLAMRSGCILSTNSDASRNCHWYGNHKNTLKEENAEYNTLHLESSFSDITVIEWAFINTP